MGRMRTREEADTVRDLIRDILASAQSNAAQPSVRNAQKHFDSFARQDYGAAIRKFYDRDQLQEILAELRRELPALNRQVFRITDPRQLGKIADELGVKLHTDRFEGSEGRSLRGFYLDDSELLARPAIWVNTATHPVGVAAAFWHEVGHHLTKRIFDDQQHRTSYSFKTNHLEHLNDASEIVADMVMVLACYPKAAAARLFTQGRPPAKDTDQLVSIVRPYVRSVTGFDFDNMFSAQENLNYLAGIVHLGKLRAALLSEYGI
jgi:hypothetical protein